MARQHGPIQLTGTLAGLTLYYNSQYGYLIRTPGGGKGAKLSPRTKENAVEMGEVSKTGKLIRRGLKSAFYMGGDSTITQRLTQCLWKVLKLDGINKRGSRKVAEGLKTAGGKLFLNSFAVLADCPADRIFPIKPDYIPERGSFIFSGLQIPNHSFPAAATHMELRGATIVANSTQNSFQLFETNSVLLQIDGAHNEFELLPHLIPSGEGCLVAAIGARFFQEVNGELISLRESACTMIVACNGI